MFQQPISELAIIADMEDRQRASMRNLESEDSYRWFDQTKSHHPNWVRQTLWHLGYALVYIGQQLESSAVNLAPAPTQQLKSISR
jgi:hypothetical protein